MRRWLLVPLLLPLLAALVVGVLNLRAPTRLRLLIWLSPPLPLGSWVLLGAAGGALLAAAAGLSAAAPGEPVMVRRQRVVAHEEPEAQVWDSAPAGPAPEPWPERSPHEAAPTVSVPFRVVQRGRPAAAAAAAAPVQRDEPEDDWGETRSDEEW
ncbi:MAG: hypothetical protein VKJ87_04275 [Synechococcus sp.]|nr:hypothetical protein [Synechococcus sp.]